MDPCSESGEQSAVNPVTQHATPPEPDDTGVQLVIDDGQSAVQSAPDFNIDGSKGVTANGRPARVRSARKRFVPETGQWT